MRRRELERRLRQRGWVLVRHGRKHDLWSDGERFEAVPRHREIDERLAQAVLARVETVRR
jgi:mRNA interferase HicA